MPLLPLDALIPVLRCPRCRGPLEARNDGLACRAPDCALGSRAFPRAGGQLALIDFARSVVIESELMERAGGSVVARRSDRGLADAIGRLASPRNRVAERMARDFVARLTATGAAPAPKLLVVGGGTRGNGAEALYETAGLDVVSFDLYASDNTQFLADAHQIPLADGCVQAVWIQAVLEHVLEPARVVAEIARVLASGGLVYAETPFLQHVHEGPWDFTRFTESGHRWLFREFERIDSGVVAGPAEVWIWATEMLTRGLTRSPAAGKLARLLWSWVRMLDRAIAPRHAVDGASCVYFFGRKSGRSIGPREAVQHYLGAQRAAQASADGKDGA